MFGHLPHVRDGVTAGSVWVSQVEGDMDLETSELEVEAINGHEGDEEETPEEPHEPQEPLSKWKIRIRMEREVREAAEAEEAIKEEEMGKALINCLSGNPMKKEYLFKTKYHIIL